MSIFTNKISNSAGLGIVMIDSKANNSNIKSNLNSKSVQIKELPGSGVLYPSMTKLKQGEAKPKHRGIDKKHKLSFSGAKKKKGLTSSGIMNSQRKKMNQSCVIAEEDFFIIPDSEKSFYIDLQDKETAHIVILKSGKNGRIDGNDNTFVIIEEDSNKLIDHYLFHLEPEDSIPNQENDYYSETGGLIFNENRAQYIVRWVKADKEAFTESNPFLSNPFIAMEEDKDFGVLQIEGGSKKVHIQTMNRNDVLSLKAKIKQVNSVGMLDLDELQIDYMESMYLREIFPLDRINLAKENFGRYENK